MPVPQVHFPILLPLPWRKERLGRLGIWGENMLFLVKWDYVWDPCRVDVNITVVYLFLEASHEHVFVWEITFTPA